MSLFRNLLAGIYSPVVSVRNGLYRRGMLSSRALGHPVISVGNLTVGGTGKTPTVIFLARSLKRAGYQPIVLSRGYRRKGGGDPRLVSDGRRILCSAEESGDEAQLMARELEGIPVAVGKDRHEAGQLFESRQLEKPIYLLDDGFQHLSLRRNLDILLLDATDPFGGGRLLPAGRLREPLSGLRRADSVIVTRSHIGRDSEALEEEIRRWNPRVPIHHFHHDATALRDIATGKKSQVRDFLGKRVLALAAVGNPAVFLYDLGHYQIPVAEQMIFRDHHPFRRSEMDRALARMKETGAEAVVTTEKDAVRLERLNPPPGRIFALRIETLPEDPEEYQRHLLSELEYLPEAR